MFSSSLLSFTILSALFFIATANSNNGIRVPLFGDFNSLPFYYVVLDIGTPSQTYTSIFDTGSSDLMVPFANCSTCIGPHFWSTSSSHTGRLQACSSGHCPICENSHCAFTNTYGGSLQEKAYFASDIVMNSDKQLTAKTTFGAIIDIKMGFTLSRKSFHRHRPWLHREFWQHRQQLVESSGVKFFYPEALWGSAYASLGNTKQQLLDHWIKASNLANVFTTCLTSKGGSLFIGGVNYAKNIQYTPITKQNFYQFHMSEMRVDGHRLPVSAPTFNQVAAIVDTGTPNVNVPVDAFAALRTYVFAQCDKGRQWPGFCDQPAGKTLLDGACLNLTANAIAQLPPLQFVLGQHHPITLTYQPQQYVQPFYACTGKEVALQLVSPGDNFTVLGATFLQGYATIYDRHNARLGFGDVTHCPTN